MADQATSTSQSQSSEPPQFHPSGRIDTSSAAADRQHDAWVAAEQEIQQATTNQRQMLEMRRAMTAQEEMTISTTIACFKCKQKQVSYTQAQIRSVDEPMTTFCECTICGNRWKYS